MRRVHLAFWVGVFNGVAIGFMIWIFFDTHKGSRPSRYKAGSGPSTNMNLHDSAGDSSVVNVNASTAVPYQHVFRYNRGLCSGMGDRLTVYQSIAALAYAVNATCYAYWCEEGHPTRLYDFAWLSKVMHYPSNLVILSKSDFFERTVGMDELLYEGGELPATLAYDGVYTLALKTMILPPRFGRDSCSQAQFEAAFRATSREWDMHIDTGHLPRRFVALHIRASDKALSREFQYTPVDAASLYCTREVLESIERHETVPIVLVSEDDLAKRLVLSDFGHVITVLNNRGLTKLQQETRDVAVLLRANAIVQHSPHGWSAFSSFAAMARGIPLLNTWRGGDSLLDRFHAAGGVPDELMTCPSLEKFMSLLKKN